LFVFIFVAIVKENKNILFNLIVKDITIDWIPAIFIAIVKEGKSIFISLISEVYKKLSICVLL
jgi:hypothetical protein